MKKLDLYINEKLHLNKDTKINTKFTDAIEKICKISGFYGLIDEVLDNLKKDNQPTNDISKKLFSDAEYVFRHWRKVDPDKIKVYIDKIDTLKKLSYIGETIIKEYKNEFEEIDFPQEEKLFDKCSLTITEGEWNESEIIHKVIIRESPKEDTLLIRYDFKWSRPYNTDGKVLNIYFSKR